MVHRRSFYSITKMNLELLALLLPSSPEPEIRSTSHDSLTAQDVCHLLANRNLSNDEYTLLLSKFIQDKSAMGDLYNTMNKVSSVLFAERYQYTDEDCSEFISEAKDKVDLVEFNMKFVEKFTKMAIAESLFDTCFVCNGTGYELGKQTANKCQHCEGTGQFIYNDINRAHMMMIKKSTFKKYKHLYEKIKNKISRIEDKALSKLGVNV